MPRLPSSLKWLIDRRARVAGEIEKIERMLAECQRLVDDIRPLKDLLTSIDQTLALHEISIDVSLIQPIKSQELRLNLPHGELTRGILLALKLAGGMPMSTDAVTSVVVARYTELSAEPISATELRTSVRYRLKNLCAQGLVKRQRSGNGARTPTWTLSGADQNLVSEEGRR